MTVGLTSIDMEVRKKEMSERGYLVLDSSSTDFGGLIEKGPIILDAGVVVFICTGGRGRIAVDMNTIPISRGSFVLLLPYSVVQVLEASDDIEVSLIATGLGFLDKLIMMQPVENYVTRIHEEPCLLLDERQLAEIEKVYYFIEERYSGACGPLAGEIRDTLMTYLALEIVTQYALNRPAEKKKLSRHEQIFRNFTHSLARNFREQRTVEFYANEACLTTKHFSAVIKQRSGKLPSEWIAERTILLIKFLLDNSDMSVQRISNELNFPNQSFFTRYFKSHEGVTPSAYRNRDNIA